MSACTTTLIVIATILGPVTIVFMAVSFGTDHWLEIDVNRGSLTNLQDVRVAERNNWRFGRFAHDRDRGLFRECYSGNETVFLDNNEAQDDVEDGNCFDVEYELEDDRDDESDYFVTRLHLNRCFLAFFILALVLFVLAYVFGLILCCLRESRWAYIAGLCSYSSAFSLAAAIAFFHGAEYIERNKLEPYEIYAFQERLNPFTDAESKRIWNEVDDATDRDYGWSYALGWVGMILAALTATFYSLAGCYLTSERYEDREYLEKHRARDYPIAMEPIYTMGTDPYYNKHYGYPRGFIGPMAPEFYARGTYPSVGYGEPGKDMWQWQEV